MSINSLQSCSPKELYKIISEIPFGKYDLIIQSDFQFLPYEGSKNFKIWPDGEIPRIITLVTRDVE